MCIHLSLESSVPGHRLWYHQHLALSSVQHAELLSAGDILSRSIYHCTFDTDHLTSWHYHIHTHL